MVSSETHNTNTLSAFLKVMRNGVEFILKVFKEKACVRSVFLFAVLLSAVD